MHNVGQQASEDRSTIVFSNTTRPPGIPGAVTFVCRSESTLAIEVTDTGVGISPEDLARVFDRFRKGSTSTGSGLGLTISRDLVEAHGGTIAMSSIPGRGTAVIVTLPLVELSA